MRACSALIALLFCIILTGCHHAGTVPHNDRSVYINFQNGHYTLIRNGKPFLVKGAAGFTNLKRLHEAGGNTIRVWDTVGLQAILDSAQANNLAVMVGITLPPSADIDVFYNNAAKTAGCYKRISATIDRYKAHPALLCWCLGNELSFPYKPKYNAFYRMLNKLTDLIHTQDPNHPVTTTLMGFQKKNIINITLRTHIDFISFNLFGALRGLNSGLKDFKWFWNGPFLISEWGIEGPWIPTEQNAWGAFIENTSTKKSEQYLEAYQKFMPVNNPAFLGSMVFYWGHKEELTPTWFSLFDDTGAETQAVGTLQNLWTGRAAATQAPQLKFMLINKQGARDNIFLKTGEVASARVLMQVPQSGLRYRWQLIAEDWYKPNGVHNEKQPDEVRDFLIGNSRADIKFKAPLHQGPYRLLAYVYDEKGDVATCNTPFYVIADPNAR